jgi:hypothetical protein
MEQIANYLPYAQQGAATLMSARAYEAEGKAQQQAGEMANAAAKFEARQMRTQAGQEQAVAQREAENRLRESALLMSRAQAVAAASGGGALDPTVLRIIGGLAAEGELAAATERYNGDERARQLKLAAVGREYEGVQAKYSGDVARSVGKWRAQNTLLQGAASMASAWGPSFKESQEAAAVDLPGYDYGYSGPSTGGFSGGIKWDR